MPPDELVNDNQVLNFTVFVFSQRLEQVSSEVLTYGTEESKRRFRKLLEGYLEKFKE